MSAYGSHKKSLPTIPNVISNEWARAPPANGSHLAMAAASLPVAAQNVCEPSSCQRGCEKFSRGHWGVDSGQPGGAGYGRALVICGEGSGEGSSEAAFNFQVVSFTSDEQWGTQLARHWRHCHNYKDINATEDHQVTTRLGFFLMGSRNIKLWWKSLVKRKEMCFIIQSTKRLKWKRAHGAGKSNQPIEAKERSD